MHHFKRLCSAVLMVGDKLTGTISGRFELLNMNAWVKSVLKTFNEDGTELVDLRMHTLLTHMAHFRSSQCKRNLVHATS